MKSQESLYRQCSAATEELIAKPPKQHGGVFTEIDVVSKAAKEDWTPDDYQRGLHDANAVCGTQYRNRKLCRFGPVVLADGSEDYARIAGKIVYADAENGPEYWETPNGKFPRLMIEEDELKRQGRRSGTERNDAKPWNEQPLSRPRRIRKRRISSIKNAKNEKEFRDILIELAERVAAMEEREAKREKALREVISA